MAENAFDLAARWNDTEKVYPLDRPLHAFIESCVEAHPDALALRFGSDSKTYRQLNAEANKLAHYLIRAGVKPDTVVGLCAERSFEMVIGLLAILKAGGAYLPLDPAYPPKRIEFMIEDAGLRHVLIQQKFRDLAASSKAASIFFDDANLWASESETHPETGVGPDHLAYVIYTSGSTGQPKGAMIEHKAIVNRLLWMQDAFHLTPEDCVLQKTPYSFDVSVWEFFWPLMMGAKLTIAKPEGHKDSDYLLDLIQQEKVTILHFVPSMLALFLEAQHLERADSLRAVICSGEALPRDLQDRFFARMHAELHNLYGPTEAAVDVSWWPCQKESALSTVPIGKPIANIQLYILNDQHQPVHIGEEGELHIGGVGLARGYLNRKELTEERFIPNPVNDAPTPRLYKTGDLCRYLPDGNIEYLGRLDFQVKIRGFRIELGEIETELKKDDSIRDCVVIAREDTPGDMRLVAYVIARPETFSVSRIQEKLKETLPEYMVPALFVPMDKFPLSSNGKLDRKALPKPDRKRPDLAQTYIAPRTDLEKQLADVWKSLLNLDRIGIDDNFFDLGGNSLLGLRMVANCRASLKLDIPIVKLFEYPSIGRLAGFLENDQPRLLIDKINERATLQRIGRFQNDVRDGVAIIGMAGRFPGASDIDTFWKNLCDGVESITVFNREELGPGIDEELRNDPDYFPARGIIENADLFDAAFFGIGPQEAKVMDPQQRIFLELAWAALENAGYCAENFDGMIGVYAGIGDNSYFPVNLAGHKQLLKMVGKLIVEYGNEKDYVATRVSYALNLTGPSVSANTGCSSSLLAVDNAFHALIDYECDMALAGGVDITVPQKSGFLYQPGGVFAKDGHCRPFDSEATGTMFNDGAGIVVLKRLSDALRDGDKIYAVIRGTAKNNDGGNKVSFLAPSVDGQARAIAMAQALANVSPEDISYIEAHGTGTPIGDPIEVEALSQVFRQFTQKKQFCGLGSVKGNIGHPTIASGVTGFIKTALALYHEQIPATLHYKKANPKIDFENSPFRVISQLTPWKRGEKPRIAGVSSFGFGGTNVHSILEEAPLPKASGSSRPKQLLLLSAKTETALDQATSNLKAYFDTHPEINFADAAYTLQTGRTAFNFRRFIVTDSVDVVSDLNTLNPIFSGTRHCESRDPEIVLLFPGQGAQYVGMGRNLYDSEPLFKKTVDTCCEILKPWLEGDLRDILYPEEENETQAYHALKNTFYTQPALFVIEYALAKLWQSWGVKPALMIGHSVGEFVCACLSGVMSLEDALKLVALRGRLMRDLPSGAMLSVRASSESIQPRLPEDVQLAAANSPSLCVVSGPDEAVSRFQAELEKDGIACKPLHTSHAFHSSMMDPIVAPYTQEVRNVKLSAPRIPFVSSVTARAITDAEAVDPNYWGRHLRMPVLFSQGIREVIEKSTGVLLEAGPRTTLSTLARQHMTGEKRLPVIASLADSSGDYGEWKALLAAAGNLWLHGITLDWAAFYRGETRHRLPLPTYPFESKRYWVDPPEVVTEYRAVPESAEISTPAAPASKTVVQSEDGDLMRRLTAILESTSGSSLDGVSPDATFIEMGMDSLLLTQVAFQLKSEFDVKISFAQLIQNVPTRRLLAEYLRKESPRYQTKITETPIKEESSTPLKTEEKLEFSTTEAQREIWLSCQMSPEASCAYNESVSLTFKGDADSNLMRQSLLDLVERHEALRSTFSRDGERIRLNPNAGAEITTVDLSKNQKTVDEEIGKIRSRDSRTPFNLETGPLLRAHLIRQKNETALILTAHHIVCDGWSLDVLLRDLAAIYTARVNSQTANLPNAPRFHAYAEETILRAESREYAEAKNFWLQRFNTLPPSLDLPLDYSRPPLRTYEGARADFEVDRAVYQNLHALGNRLNCSLFNIVLAGYVMFLHRLTEQSDIVVGIPAAGQPIHNLKHLVGHCVTLLPFRANVQSDETTADFIQKIQKDLLDAYDHLFTYGSLLKELKVEREPGRMPLLAVGLTNSSAYKEGDLRFADLKLSYALNPRSFETFEWYMNAREDNGRLILQCHYNTRLFSAETMQFRLREFATLLGHLADSENTPIGQLPLLSAEEEDLVLNRWNQTEMAIDPELRLHSLFVKQVRISPKAKAVLSDSKTLSYAELEGRANQLAHYLIQKGMGPGSVAGILLERSVDALVAILGVLKSGAAYLPLDPSFPAKRLAYMMEDSGAACVLVTESTEKLIDTFKGSVIRLDAEEQAIRNYPQSHPSVLPKYRAPSSTDMAYMIYTSGSTGKPKGVEIPHKAAVNFILSMQKEPGLSKNDRMLALTTISFDISVLEMFLPLSVGASLAVIRQEETNDGKRLIDAIRRFGITAVQATPASWKLMITAGLKSPGKLLALCGGEAMPPDLMPQLCRIASSAWNMYGPTETTVWSTCHPLREDGPLLIGKPIANTKIYILNEDLKPVPVGTFGELYIGGEGVARGYHSRPDLTNERFLSNPFIPGSRMYKTGDLCRFKPDGSIEYSSRIDTQVKIRGYRIELGEIETVLRGHPAVRDVAVTVKGEAETQRLVAYLVLKSNEKMPATESLRKFCGEMLPDYVVPAQFVSLDTLPLTPNGKVDRKALPDPGTHRLETGNRYVPPETEEEKALAEIWQELFHLDKIGVEDNFFNIGGHSLLAAQMFLEVDKRLHVNIPLASLFKAPTIRQIASLIRHQGHKIEWSSLVPIHSGGSKPPLFLVHGAEGNVLLYRELAHYLGDEQPVFGLQSKGLDGKTEFDPTFEVVAKQYIDELKAQQPEGPYYLGGYCLGGTIALEMAQQLKAGGDEVAFLGMIETYNIQTVSLPLPKPVQHLNKALNVWHHIDNMLSSRNSEKMKFFKKKSSTEISRMKVSLNLQRAHFARILGLPDAENYPHIRVDRAYDGAQLAYQPKSYDGEITLFVPKNRLIGFNDNLWGWSHIAQKGIDLHESNINPRGTLVEPYVKQLAKILSECLQKAKGKGR